MELVSYLNNPYEDCETIDLDEVFEGLSKEFEELEIKQKDCYETRNTKNKLYTKIYIS